MFTLGVITDEISQDFERALDLMKEWGIPQAEIRGLWGKNVSALSQEELQQAKNCLEKRGISVCGIASPFYKCELSGGKALQTGRLHLAEDRTLDEQKDVLERCIQAAKTLGTNLIRIFAFWRRGPLTPEIADQIEALLQEPLEIAQEAGVCLALENEHDCYMSTGGETAQFLARPSLKNLSAVWDPGNAFCAGEIPYPDGYNAIKSRIVHIHIKDPKRDPETGKIHFVPIGQGEIAYREHFRALIQEGYSGAVSLETHFKGPDGNTETGTYLALQGLKQILREL